MISSHPLLARAPTGPHLPDVATLSPGALHAVAPDALDSGRSRRKLPTSLRASVGAFVQTPVIRLDPRARRWRSATSSKRVEAVLGSGVQRIPVRPQLRCAGASRRRHAPTPTSFAAQFLCSHAHRPRAHHAEGSDGRRAADCQASTARRCRRWRSTVERSANPGAQRGDRRPQGRQARGQASVTLHRRRVARDRHRGSAARESQVTPSPGQHRGRGPTRHARTGRGHLHSAVEGRHVTDRVDWCCPGWRWARARGRHGRLRAERLVDAQERLHVAEPDGRRQERVRTERRGKAVRREHVRDALHGRVRRGGRRSRRDDRGRALVSQAETLGDWGADPAGLWPDLGRRGDALSGRRRIVGFVIVVSMIACNAVLGIDHYRDYAGWSAGTARSTLASTRRRATRRLAHRRRGLATRSPACRTRVFAPASAPPRAARTAASTGLGGACILGHVSAGRPREQRDVGELRPCGRRHERLLDGRCERRGGFVRAMPRGGGTPVTALRKVGQTSSFTPIAVYSTGTVFYSEINKDHLVYSVPIDGGTGIPIASVKYASDLGIDGTGVYMVDTSGTVYATSFDGGALRTVASAGSRRSRSPSVTASSTGAGGMGPTEAAPEPCGAHPRPQPTPPRSWSRPTRRPWASPSRRRRRTGSTSSEARAWPPRLCQAEARSLRSAVRSTDRGLRSIAATSTGRTTRAAPSPRRRSVADRRPSSRPTSSALGHRRRRRGGLLGQPKWRCWRLQPRLHHAPGEVTPRGAVHRSVVQFFAHSPPWPIAECPCAAARTRIAW